MTLHKLTPTFAIEAGEVFPVKIFLIYFSQKHYAIGTVWPDGLSKNPPNIVKELCC